jgi:4-amino-4-deoxy-L-arabinose transferase-like glycosyltransferase
MAERNSRGTESTPILRDRVFLLAMAICLFLLSPTIFWGFGRDQGNLGYMAWMLTKGNLPYVNTWDSNFPGVIALHAACIAVLGTSTVAYRIVDILFMLFASGLIYAFARFLAGRWAGFWAAVSYAVLYLTLGYWFTGQRDGFATVFTLAGVGGLLRFGLRPRYFWLVLSGLCGGIALSIRPQFGIVLLVMAAWVLFAPADGRRTIRSRVIGTGVFLAGLALPSAVWLAVYAASGHLRDVYETVIYYNFRVHANIRESALTIWKTSSGRTPLFLWLGTAWLLLSIERATFRRQFALLLAAVLAAFLASRFVEGKSWEYHQIPVFALAGALGMAGLIRAGQQLSPRLTPTTRRVAVGLAIAGMLYWFRIVFPFSTIVNVAKTGCMDGDYPREKTFGFIVETDHQIANYIREQTRPDDRIQVWSGAAIIYYLSERQASSRFQTSAQLVMRKRRGQLTAIQQRWRNEFIADLNAHPPKFFLVEDYDRPTYMGLAQGKTSRMVFEEFLDLYVFVTRRYHPAGTFGNFQIYRRNDT